jgi:serine protease Do
MAVGHFSMVPMQESVARNECAKSGIHFSVFSALVFFLVCGAMAAVTPLLAQTPATLPASLQKTKVEERAELQRELERNAEVLEAQSAVVRTVAKLIGPAVVHIEADMPPENSVQYGRGRSRIEEAGSGVIIERNGEFYVLTNQHVIRNADTQAIRIHLADGRGMHPTKVWQDTSTDVAVLAISAPDLIAAPVSEKRPAEIGDFVLAIGSPFGLSHSVTFGIISAKGRCGLQLSKELDFQYFLQTDAAINPGNSGGPLVNLRGEVIGINTAIASNSGGNEGIGFAIPIDVFMAFARQLLETGKVAHAYLGVNLDANFGPAMALELGLPRPIGTRISGILPNSPAESAKLQIGDVILEFDNTPVENDAHLVNLVGMTEVGKSVPMTIFRDRKPLTVLVDVAEKSKASKKP